MSFRTHVKSTKQLETFFSWPNTEKPCHNKAHLLVTVLKLNNLKSWTPIKGPLKNIRHLYRSTQYYRPQSNAFFFQGNPSKKNSLPVVPLSYLKMNLPLKKWKGNLKETSPQGWLNCFCLPTASFFQVDHHPQLLQISWLVNLSPPQYVPPPEIACLMKMKTSNHWFPIIRRYY